MECLLGKSPLGVNIDSVPLETRTEEVCQIYFRDFFICPNLLVLASCQLNINTLDVTSLPVH